MKEELLPLYQSDYRLFRIIVQALLLFTVMIVFVPFNPIMPTTGGDPSWMFGMNQATAQRLVFGKDIVFTFGPYNSVYTKAYHPDTDHLMVFGSLVLGIFHVILIFALTKERSVIWQIAFALFLAAGIFSRDVLLYLYPLLLSFFVYRSANKGDSEIQMTFEKKFIFLMLFLPFGLLVLIKGSMLILTVGITGFCAVLFWLKGMKKLAVSIIIMPLLAAIFFLVIAKQPITGLWYYFKSMITVSGGYSEAMYVDGPNGEIILYLIVSFIILWLCIRQKDCSKQSRLFLFFSLILLLFTAFKNGFTRHDSHSLIAAATILMTGFLLYTIIRHKYLHLVFLLSFFSWIYISYSYVGQNVLNIFRPVPSIYAESLDGLMARLSGNNTLKTRYRERLDEIRKEQPNIPLLTGTTDLYSYEQSYLLATGNKWSPRPVIQSYAVYTGRMAEINEKHLTGSKAPDNIIFRLQTIDERQPSLDDGFSWPTIINNYNVGNIVAGFMFLKKKRIKNISPAKEKIFHRVCKLGEEVIVSDTSQVLFAQFDINQTLMGKIVTALYQPEPLKIYITLSDNSVKNYRFIPNMARSGFILSPLIENIDDFGLLFGNRSPLRNKYIKSFRIEKDGLGFRKRFKSWNDQYTVTFSKLIYSE